MLPVFLSSRTIILDCGASRTALGVFSRQGARLRLDHYAAEAFPLHSGSEDNWLENTRVAFRSLSQRMKMPGPVVLTLPAHLTLTKLIKTPRVEPAQREKIIRFEAGQNIPVALSDVVWDSVVVGESGGDMEIMLAAAKLDSVEPLCAAAQEAGFEPGLVLPSSVGTLAGFRLVQPARVETCLVLNLGVRSTTLLLVEPGRFVLRTFASGGNVVTPPMTEDQDGDSKEAVENESPGGAASQKTDGSEHVKTRLLQEITRTVLHFRWQNRMTNPERVYLFGEASRLPGLDEALTTRLKVSVDRLDLPGAIEIASGAAGSRAAGYAPALTDLICAAATQLRPNQPVLDLLPPRRRHLMNRRQRQPWLIVAAMLAVAVLLPPLAHFRSMVDEADKKTAAIERALGPLRQRELRNRTSRQRLDGLTKQIGRLEGVYARRASWLALLADMEDRLARVEDVWLERLQVAPGVTGMPLKLAISGRMLDRTNPLSKAGPETFNRVKTLLASLADSPFVAAVEAEQFDSSQPGILKFDFVLVANPHQPL